MTEDGPPLAELLQKAGEGDFLRTVAEAVLQILMEADAEGLVDAGRHERSPDRLSYRNGYRDRTLDTRLGSLQLREADAGLRSLAEPWADTTTPAGRMVPIVFAGIAEFERALIHERTGAGRAAARARGVRFGRPSKLTPEQAALGRRLVEEGGSVRQVARVILKCHPATLYRELAKVTPVEGDAASAG